MDHLAQVFRKETPDRKKTVDDLKRQFDQTRPDLTKWPIDIKPGDIVC